MKTAKKAPPALLAAPWPQPRAAAWAALVLGAVALAAYGPYIRQLGFYLDDWVVFEHMLGAASWRERAGSLMGIGYAPRPLSAFVYPTLFRFAGFEPLAYQVLLIVQCWASALAYFVLLRRWLGSDRTALAAAVLGLVYPVSVATHACMSTLPQQIAILLTFASMIAHLEWLERRGLLRLALTAVLYGAALSLYEASAFLPAMTAAALFPRLRARELAKDVLLPFALVLCAAALWQRFGGPWLMGKPHPKTVAVSLGWILRSYAAALECLGPKAWRLVAGTGPRDFPVGMNLFGALIAAGAAWAVARLEPRKEPGLPAAAAVAAAGLLGAYLPFALSGAYKPQVSGIMSRVNASGALIGGLILAAALDALRRRLGRTVHAVLFTALLAGFTWTNWAAARLWADSWILQRDILAKVSARLAKLPDAKTVILNNIPGNRGAAEVFSEHWGFSAALRVASGRKDVYGLVAQPCMRAEPRGIADYCAKPPVVTPYAGLYIYDAASNEMKRPAAM